LKLLKHISFIFDPKVTSDALDDDLLLICLVSGTW